MAGVLPAQSGTITNNGNRSYDIPFASSVASILTPGMRLRTTRTVTAPTQCADLEASSTQYFSKSSPNKLTFTDDFVISAWVKAESYTAGAIVSRYDGTSGWQLQMNASGQILIAGYNGGAANSRAITSYQSIPLGKWVHVAAQLDMSTYTATTTTCYVMIDGVDVPGLLSSGGTNPTALVQAGNLNIGAINASQPFDGKIAQVAIYNAKVTQATIKASMNQTLSGSETSLASAYSFNGVITDLNTTTPNDLTANGGALATATDSPFTLDANGVPSGTTDYAIVTKVVTSTATVQVPEGCTIPTSGGVSAVAYSTQAVPYGFPRDSGRWRIVSLLRTNSVTTSNATYGAFISAGYALTVPVGAWTVGHMGNYYNTTTTTVNFNISSTALTGLTGTAGNDASPFNVSTKSSAAAVYTNTAHVQQPQTISAVATYVMYTVGATTSAGIGGTDSPCAIFAELAYL